MTSQVVKVVFALSGHTYCVDLKTADVYVRGQQVTIIITYHAGHQLGMNRPNWADEMLYEKLRSWFNQTERDNL